MRSRDSRRRATAWLLLAAVVLHNGEEALTYGWTLPAAGRLVSGMVDKHVVLPLVEAFRAVLLVLTAGAAALLGWAGGGRDSPSKGRALRLVALVLLANVLIPHVPAAVLLNGYAPGLVTAVLVNVPVAVVVLWPACGESQHPA